MKSWIVRVLTQCLRLLRQLLSQLQRRARWRAWTPRDAAVASGPVFAQPKPKWVRNDVIRLKALLPQTGCRTIAHHFNRRWSAKRDMTVSKTYVADTCRRHQYLSYEARRKLKHRVPRPMPRNRIWGCDLLTKTDQREQPHLALALVDPAVVRAYDCRDGEQVLVGVVAGTGSRSETVWSATVLADGQ
jgi:putative transposase